MSDHASVCLLSYNRINMLREAVATVHRNANYPHEVIVHDDGSDIATQTGLMWMLQAGEISKLILNPIGHNQGVGEAVRVAFGAASGNVLVKVDQDLSFRPGWLEWAVRTLGQADGWIGMVGFFHYHHRPVVSADMFIAQHDGWQEHADFVSSAFAIRRGVYGAYDWPTHRAQFDEDVTFKNVLQGDGYKLALPNDDLALNLGFGYGTSTICLAPGQVATIHDAPLIHA